MNRVIAIVMLMLVLSVVDTMAQDSKPLVAYVHNLQQAEDILRPQARKLVITRDPFKPIITPAPKPSRTNAGVKLAAAVAVPVDRLDDVKVVGIVSLGQEYRAYIMVGTIARVVNVQDTVRKYTINSINMNEVVFKSGNKEITKKRGKL